ncbi:LysR substrate-binding domain-containing protein [Streptomyces sp. NPDC101062]|uniref:LysR substrate-binding domain-containing protein n=1 Tax=unclassified Streptomyces TaxID=2593676 RepID=UPI002E7958FF|nr:LysR substrate-binding domain-containing protein [Streptomyces sp. JV176]MEE1802696.1 LysR substrate-binding domain-containing protein [Streptomyces sp. JV176]
MSGTMDLTGSGLRYFLEVAHIGSIGQASERLHVAASAISRQIAKLEHDIGVPLFERRPRGMVLSEAGEILAAYARRHQLESEQALTDIRSLGALRHSTIRLASSEGFARDFLPETIVAFREKYPGVQFQLHVTSPGGATQQVRDGTADLAVTYSLAPEKDIRVEFSAAQPIYALMPDGHPLADREEIWLADLLPYPLAVMEQGTTIRQVFDICVSLEGLAFEPAFVSNYSGALESFVRMRGGVTLVGYLTIRRRLGTDGMKAVPIRNPELSRRSVQIQSMARRALPAAVSAFLAHLVTHTEGP